MNQKLKQSIYLLVFLLAVQTVTAQSGSKLGITVGAARFYPDDEGFLFKLNHNNTLSNSWGWSAGMFFEKPWTSKIHQMFEVNYSDYSTDIFLQKNPDGPWSPGDGTGREPIIGDYNNTKYNYLSFSWGFKYYVNNKLFVYPSLDVAKTLNEDISINKILPNAKLSAGMEIQKVNLLLEYSYSLEKQQRIFDLSVPFIVTHRNKLLQLKVQIPLFDFGNQL